MRSSESNWSPTQSQNKMKPQSQLLVAAIQREIDRLNAVKKKLRSLDSEIVCQAIDVFDSVDGAAIWLASPAFGLEGRVPLDVADTPKGMDEVMNLLGRVDHGVS
jgi:putative toxin-antitoxin system antitoxin component (TIGR02293 family)